MNMDDKRKAEQNKRPSIVGKWSSKKKLAVSDLEELASYIEKKVGLVFTTEKRRELEIKLAEHPDLKTKTSRQFLFDVRRSPEALQELVNRLTIGESYFFRNRPHFDALKENIIPDLIERLKKKGGLRVWCAGCASGEEPYSLAILLEEHFPELSKWDMSITATDINTGFLDKAREGVFTRWSFRGVSNDTIEKYFTQEGENRFRLDPRIARRVRFKWLNLAHLPLEGELFSEPFDLIFCRNVLIYFTYQMANRVVEEMGDILTPGGYLLVGHSEAFPALGDMETVYSHATYYYRKRSGETIVPSSGRQTRLTLPGIGVDTIIPMSPERSDTSEMYRTPGGGLASKGQQWTDPSGGGTGTRRFIRPKGLVTQTDWVTKEIDKGLKAARETADRGKIHEAVSLLDDLASGKGKLDYRVHFLRAIIEDQAGKSSEAIKSLRQAIFLNKKFVIGHFYLGVIHERAGDNRSAEKYFRNVRNLLESLPLEHPVEEAEGLTVGRLLEIVETRSQEVLR